MIEWEKHYQTVQLKIWSRYDLSLGTACWSLTRCMVKEIFIVNHKKNILWEKTLIIYGIKECSLMACTFLFWLLIKLIHYRGPIKDEKHDIQHDVG